MKRYSYKDLTIEILSEPNYKLGSADNNFNYEVTYFIEDGANSPGHGIKIYRNEQIIKSCVIIGASGATMVTQHSSLIDNSHLLLCCGDTIFCLSLPQLDPKWKTRADMATCFQIFKLKEDYIVHGELQITRIDSNGVIKWQFGGADIFVCLDGESEFKLEEDHIMLMDFGKTMYKIDFNSHVIWDTYKH